ncbi:MAG: VOC family protein [Alphaproteobacteria bacterium]|nr:VOC family protein [Alphaproteobacteria bacterium]
MIAAIVPQFFSADLEKTLHYYDTRLGFETQFEYGNPTTYAGAIRDGLSIFFRHLDCPPALPPDKYSNELLDAYLRVDDIAKLHSEYTSRNVEVTRGLADRPWGFTEFVIKDVDGRLLCFGQMSELVSQHP